MNNYFEAFVSMEFISHVVKRICLLPLLIAVPFSQTIAQDVGTAGEALRIMARSDAPQDFSFNDDGSVLYVQTVSGTAPNERSSVTRFAVSGGRVKALDSTGELDWLGHQGISEEPSRKGETWLWGSAGAGAGRSAVRFEYKGAGTPEPQIYQLFDQRYAGNSVSMPKVCLDSQTLIARGRRSGGQFLRVFDLRELTAGGPGDYSMRYRAEWKIPPQVFDDHAPLQGLACDSQHVYMLVGKNGLDERKGFYVFTNDGRMLSENTSFSVGKSVAKDEGRYYEPEGLALHEEPGYGAALYAGIVSAAHKRRNLRLWRLDDAADGRK
ncbi:hypothetical protein [Caballeronia sp. INDeC2]|uniref:phage baseplate protein n=1 Tax=Caballeronia sp. INDeC2 TaxID=2921747 RepID=UPI0020286B84|nr:hypothetical protein [Caballeronia sp. INDeC2]